MYIFIFLFAYLIGSVSSASIISKVFYNQDIKKVGSGNAGATNTLRNYGKLAGAGVLIFDCFKGFIAVYIASKLQGDVAAYIAGIGAIIGHTWPIYFKFKGGKGVATGLGIFLYLDVKMVLILFVIFVLIVLITKYVSLASISVAALAPIYTYFIHYKNSPLYFYMVLFVALLIIFNHRANVDRLLKGNENKLRKVK